MHYLMFEENMGIVKDIALRATTHCFLRSREKKTIIIFVSIKQSQIRLKIYSKKY